jgi:hypothetical protein
MQRVYAEQPNAEALDADTLWKLYSRFEHRNRSTAER